MSQIPQYIAVALVCLLPLRADADESKLALVIPRDLAGHSARDEDREPFTCVAISADGKWVAAGTVHDSVFLWSAQSGKLVQEFPDHVAAITALALSRDGKQLLTASEEGTVIQWETNPPRKVRTFPTFLGVIRALAFSADGKKMMTSSTHGPLTLWDVKTGHRLASVSPTRGTEFAQLSGDASRALTLDHESITLWDLSIGKKLNSVSVPASAIRKARFSLPADAYFSRDGKFVIIRGLGRSWTTWNAGTGKKLEQEKWLTETHVNVEDNFDRKWSNLVGYASYVRDVKDGPEARIAWIPDTYADRRMAISGDGTYAAVIGTRRYVALDRTKDRIELRVPDKRTVRLSSDWWASASFADDGKHVTASTTNGVVWNIAAGTAKQTYRSVPINSELSSFSEDRQWVASVVDDNIAIVRDAKRGVIVRRLPGYEQPISALALSPDGKRVFVGCSGHTGDLWDVESGKRIQTFSGPRTYRGASLSPDGRRLLTLCNDETIRLWDLTSGKELLSFFSFNSGKDWLATTPDGHFDGSDGARQFARFRIAGTLDLAPADEAAKFYRPGLVRTVLNSGPVK